MTIITIDTDEIANAACRFLNRGLMRLGVMVLPTETFDIMTDTDRVIRESWVNAVDEPRNASEPEPAHQETVEDYSEEDGTLDDDMPLIADPPTVVGKKGKGKASVSY